MTKREKINQIIDYFLINLSKEQQDKIIRQFEEMGTPGGDQIAKILQSAQNVQQGGKRVQRIKDRIIKRVNQIADEQ